MGIADKKVYHLTKTYNKATVRRLGAKYKDQWNKQNVQKHKVIWFQGFSWIKITLVLIFFLYNDVRQ